MSGGIGAAAGGALAGSSVSTGSVLASTFLLAGSQALGILTAPGPRRGTFQEFVVNPGEASDVWPYVAGTVEMVPHLITYFDFASKKVKNDVGIDEMLVSAGLSGLAGYVAGGGNFITSPPPTAIVGVATGAVSGAVVAGLGQLRTASYRYYCGFLYGICHGPIDEVSAAKIDERIVYTGSDNAGDSILIDDPQAWGGDHQDGGFYALCDIVRGDFWPTQLPSSYLVAQLGSSVPAYSGKSLFIVRGPSGFTESGYFAATPGGSPLLRPLKLRVGRWPNNLGVPTYKKVSTSDANPAECCYEWLTSPAFGVKKLPTSKVDIASFQAGAQTHFTEGLGCSVQFNADTDVETALDTFSQLADVVIFGGFRTGTIKYRPIRRDYSIPALDVFRRGSDGSSPSDYNVIAVEGFTPGSWSSTVNDFKFSYIDRDNNYIETTRNFQDLANRLITGKTRSLSQTLQGVSNGTTASLVGTREMRAGSYPRPPLTLIVNRDAHAKEPGNVIKYIDNVDDYTKILRIAEVQSGTEDDSEIRLICVEDQYGVGASAFNAFVPSGFTDPVGTAVAASLSVVLEAPYYLTHDDDARLLVFAAKPNNAHQNFDTYVSTDAGVTYTQQGDDIDFAITGTITESVARLTAATVATLTFTPSSTFDATRLASATAAEIAEGENIIYWPDTGEFMAVETITDNGDGTYTLTTVWRAVSPFDSVPAPHVAGQRVWLFTYGYLVTTTEYASTTATKTKILPQTVSARLALASATATDVTIGTRALKPNPVRGVTIGGSYTLTEIGASDDVVVAWGETNRTTEATVVKQTDAGVTPEATSTYTVRWYATEGGGNVLLRTESGVVASTGLQTATMTTAEEAASPNYLGHLSTAYRIEVEVLRGSYTSTTYIREVTRVGSGGSGTSGFVIVNGVDVHHNAELVQVT